MYKENNKHITNLLIGMLQNNIINEYGNEHFEDWCESNIYNEEQQKILDDIKYYVDNITNILTNNVEKEKR